MALFHEFIIFSFEGVTKLLTLEAEEKWNPYNVVDIRQRLTNQGLDVKNLSYLPIMEDSIDWQNSIRDYMQEYLTVFYPNNDALLEDKVAVEWYSQLNEYVKGITQYTSLKEAKEPINEVLRICEIFMVVSVIIHECLGSLAYNLHADPYTIPNRMRKGKTFEEKLPSRYEQKLATLACYATTIESPKIFRDWSYMAPPTDKDGKAVEIMKNFYETMKKIGERIKKRNESRAYPTNVLTPERLNCSIAV